MEVLRCAILQRWAELTHTYRPIHFEYHNIRISHLIDVTRSYFVELDPSALQSILEAASAAQALQLMTQLSKHTTSWQFCYACVYKRFLLARDIHLHIFGNLVEYLDEQFVLQFISCGHFANTHRLAWVIMLVCKYHSYIGAWLLNERASQIVESSFIDNKMKLSANIYLLKAFQHVFRDETVFYYLASSDAFTRLCDTLLSAEQPVTVAEAMFILGSFENLYFDRISAPNYEIVFTAMLRMKYNVSEMQIRDFQNGTCYPYGLRYCIALYGVTSVDDQAVCEKRKQNCNYDAADEMRLVDEG